MDFKPGIYEDLDYSTYDSIPAWRSHDLTSLAKCPYTWKHGVFKETPALLEGRVQHSVFLEHHKFFDEYAICLLYTSPSPRDYAASRMPSSA